MQVSHPSSDRDEMPIDVGPLTGAGERRAVARRSIGSCADAERSSARSMASGPPMRRGALPSARTQRVRCPHTPPRR